MRKIILPVLIELVGLIFPTKIFATAITIRSDYSPPTSVRVYEKYEIHFDVSPLPKYPFFQYDANPPSGVAAGSGITVEGVFTANGKTWIHPGFYMTETRNVGTAAVPRFEETNKKYWVVRFSPQDQGNFNVQLRVIDSLGVSTINAGSFIATPPVKDGFIKVAAGDKRYFEFSNGKIFWPIGPVYWDENFSQYKDTGLNFSRPWMGGLGAYSANWARWKSSAEDSGNEGAATRVAFLGASERFPGSDGLAYDLDNVTAQFYWLTGWGDDYSYTPIKPNTTYQLKLTAKTVGITGPRNSAYPYGLTVKFYDPIWNDPTVQEVENTVRNAPKPFGHITGTSGTNGWQTFQTTFTAPSGIGSDIWILLDNVTGGKAYIYELSIKDSSGAELVRNPVADMHTYVEQRPAAFFDWQVQQAEANGIYLKYNVHDKNDPIFNSLNADGSWGGWWQGDGYNQGYNTKSSWLKRQWYRYLIARYGYSTAVHSWEAVNEADPNDSTHWQNVQENLAAYIKTVSAHPTMAVTSFWCCSYNDGFRFYSNYNNLYPDIAYVDLHEYSGNPNTTDDEYTNDVAEWVRQVGEVAYTKNAGKPLIWAENGLSTLWNSLTDSRLTSSNPGTWYHNMLWAQLTRGAAFPIGYWFDTEHLEKITGGKQSVTKAFYAFVRDLDFHKGGYGEIGAGSSNPKLRVYGQKKADLTKAVFWVQNSGSEWNKTPTAQSGNITLTLKPSTTYTVERWNTYCAGITGCILNTTTATTNASGAMTISVSSLITDTAYKIYSENTTLPKIGIADLRLAIQNFINVFNINSIIANYGK